MHLIYQIYFKNKYKNLFKVNNSINKKNIIGGFVMRNNEKIQKFIIVGIVLTAIIIIIFTAKFINKRTTSHSQNDDSIESEIVSTQIGKTTEEAKDELINETEFETAELVVSNETNQIENSPANTAEIQEENNTIIDNNITNTKKDISNTSSKSKEKSKLTFIPPISGTILREFAKDSLVYSDTLKEWITHKGVDIKADKTSVVSSAADGKIYAIKNDPRYGLTIIINHDNGFQTIYSNLLTAEFVVEGEEVKSGQSIGTVGNTASFEVLDDYHLHFELLQNNEYLDPSIYINFD